MQLSHVLMTGAGILVVLGVLAVAWLIAVPADLEGATLDLGSSRYRLETTSYWRISRAVETAVVLRDDRGIVRVEREPLVRVHFEDVENGKITVAEHELASDLIGSDTLRWSIATRVPPGQRFLTVSLFDGSYQDMSGQTHAIDWNPLVESGSE